jgi:hypothetical protein
VVLGPEELPVEVLQFHPTVDGVLVSTAGKTVKVWDVAKQQPLTGTVTLEGLPFSGSPCLDNPPFSIGVFGSVFFKKSRVGEMAQWVRVPNCSSRGPEFKSQQPHGGSQPPVTRSDALFWCV